MNLNTMLLPSAYLAVFALSVFAILWWERRKRGTRAPFAKDLRLLRVAGEHQLKRIDKLDGDFFLMMLAAAGVPCLGAVILLEGVMRLTGWWLLAGSAVVGLVFLAALILALRWFVARLCERGDRYLGYVGERVVAEYLEPLRAAGWLIFHDVPCETGKDKFNIDHVAVGPGGVFAVETKARRKGATREGREDYKVFFDGEQLSWPWGEDQHGLDQTLRNAKWLQQWLGKTTGEKLEVVPVLALPGWTVEAPARAAVRVVNPTWLPELLAGAGATILSGKQVELCGRQLEQRCRDVEF